MPSVFENLSDGFYTAFFEPESEKRQVAIEAWVKAAAPIIQPAIEEDLRRYLKTIMTKDLDTPEGYRMRAEKFKRIMDTYKLCLDVTIRQVNKKHDYIAEPLSPEVRTRTLEAAKKALPEVTPVQVPLRPPSTQPPQQPEDDDYDDDKGGRSSNDDRSDSMNPNNDAYWSSRGR